MFQKNEISTSQNEPPTDYRVDRDAEYECFADGGYADANLTDVRNSTVNCK